VHTLQRSTTRDKSSFTTTLSDAAVGTGAVDRAMQWAEGTNMCHHDC
jgi:hypothetical protein